MFPTLGTRNEARMYTLLDRPLHTIPFVLFDMESTGLDVQIGHRICEMAAMRIQGREIIDRCEFLVNPQREIDPAAFAVNGISAEMVAHAPAFGEIWPKVNKLFHEAVLVAHNAYFDIGFLTSELSRINLPPLETPVIDTLALARRYITARRYNLTSLATNLGEKAPSHRAMSDVVALRPVFEHLLDILYRKGVHTLADLLRAQRGLLPGDEESPLIQEISTAMTSRQSLMISYRTAGGDPVERRVLPMGLTVEGKRHILHAYCYLRNAQRMFALDRLSIVEL